MTKERLEGLPVEVLNNLLSKQNIVLPPLSGKKEIIEALLESYQEDREEKSKLHNLIIKIEEAKFAIAQDHFTDIFVDEEFVFPEYYDETYIKVLPRDPSWCFAYWEVKKSLTSVLEKEWGFQELFIRVCHLESSFFDEKKSYPFQDIPIQTTFGSRYINLPHGNSYYILEIRARMEEGERFLARSNPFLTPPSSAPYCETPQRMKESLEGILALSGLKTCEPTRGEETDNIQENFNPHRIGLLDDEEFED